MSTFQQARCLVGVPQSGYAVERNILGSIPRWASVRRPLDPRRLLSAARYRLTGELRFDELFCFSEPYLPRVDLLHFFNTVAGTRTPWVCTFEHCLPRWDRAGAGVSDRQHAHGVELMLRDACRALIAFSEATRNVALNDWIERAGPDRARELVRKVRILLPPQPIIAEPQERRGGEPPLLAFVGADFYRKGGLEVLIALDRLRERGIRDWRAEVVGRLGSFGDYASGTDASSRVRALQLLGRLSGLVTHRERMPPTEVMALFRRSSFYLFPTLADTFGYSALEAMACGAVVVTTNVRAMAEVVDGQIGYSIALPLDPNRDAHTLPGFGRTKEALAEQLEAVIEAALAAGEGVRLAKASAATVQLRLRHDPSAHARAIEAMYRSALDGG